MCAKSVYWWVATEIADTAGLTVTRVPVLTLQGVRRPQSTRKRFKKLGDVGAHEYPRDADQLREELFGEGEGGNTIAAF